MSEIPRLSDGWRRVDAERRAHNPKPQDVLQEPLYLADRRLIVGPQVGRISVDHTPLKLIRGRYLLLRTLAERADDPQDPTQLISAIWEWKDPSPGVVDKFLPTLHKYLNTVRTQLGDELGDSRYGAVRTIFSGDEDVPNTYVGAQSLND